MANIELNYFASINLNDTFFDSLKNDYTHFSTWYNKKSEENAIAYTLNTEYGLSAFLYLKIENIIDTSIIPKLSEKKRLKVGTFKINAHGTKLGERFVKKIFDNATENNIDEIYVTVFKHHESLINLLETFGFKNYGKKTSTDGTEIVLIKSIGDIIYDVLKDYPCVVTENTQKHVLSILPQYHSRLFPDSILNNESYNLLEDISHANSIYKVYMAKMSGITDFNVGDSIFIYRTKDDKGSAFYRSVITSLCVVKEVKNINDFNTFDEFNRYVSAFTIFTYEELRYFFNTKRYPYIIKMTYNVAFNKRVTNGKLIEMGINPDYWGVFKVSNEEFYQILEAGVVNESLIVN